LAEKAAGQGEFEDLFVGLLLKMRRKDPAKLAQLRRGASPPLHAVEAFMLALTSANDGKHICLWAYVSANQIRSLDGRVCFSITGNPNQEQIEVKYQLLNPSTPFRDVVDTARSVVLAGGTMSPVCRLLEIFSIFSDPFLQISDVVAQLFSHLPPARLSNFSCGHIIPPSNLQTLVVGKGPRGSDLEFTFDRRGDKSIVS
jgi:chromosome transmission fidelity protein 1